MKLWKSDLVSDEMIKELMDVYNNWNAFVFNMNFSVNKLSGIYEYTILKDFPVYFETNGEKGIVINSDDDAKAYFVPDFVEVDLGKNKIISSKCLTILEIQY